MSCDVVGQYLRSPARTILSMDIIQLNSSGAFYSRDEQSSQKKEDE